MNQKFPVAIVGAGAMGTGIAQVAATAGHPVRLFDVRKGAAEAAGDAVRAMLAKLAAKGKISPRTADDAGGLLFPAKAFTELSDAGLAIEAIVENLEEKHRLLTALEAQVAPDCLLATNTSSLSIPDIAAALQSPQRLVGMHFFNPAPLMDLVEVVGGVSTDPMALDQVAAIARLWGKTPVRARSTPGFIVNRVARPFYAEGLRLLAERAADVATLDAVMRECGGFRMGPLELTDLIGQDVNFAVTRAVFEGYFGDPRFTPSLLQQELVAAGWLGRKTGRGFYQYGETVAAPQPVSEPTEPAPKQIAMAGEGRLVELLTQRLEGGGVKVVSGGGGIGISDGRTAAELAAQPPPNLLPLVLVDLAYDYTSATRIAIARSPRCPEPAYREAVGALQAAGFSVSPLRDLPGLAVLRTVAMLANEAADAVYFGIANAADVDLAMRKGVNYPRGPLAWADLIGIPALQTVLTHLGAHYGEDRYRVSPLIRELAFNEGRFLD